MNFTLIPIPTYLLFDFFLIFSALSTKWPQRNEENRKANTSTTKKREDRNTKSQFKGKKNQREINDKEMTSIKQDM